MRNKSSQKNLIFGHVIKMLDFAHFKKVYPKWEIFKKSTEKRQLCTKIDSLCILKLNFVIFVYLVYNLVNFIAATVIKKC